METQNNVNVQSINKLKVHFTFSNFIQPTNPITVNLIGAGGTGSQMLTALGRINYALNEMNHPGLSVRLWDDDRVEEANLGRQLFAESELGLYKATALINRTNRFFGTVWKAENRKFEKDNFGKVTHNMPANIFISCVDNVTTRFEIAEVLKTLDNTYIYGNTAKYWMDFGNSKFTGQVLLSTIGSIRQPESEKYETVSSLAFITDEFGDLLKQSETIDDTPSCSLAEALDKQDLFINSSLAQLGGSLLWNLFRNGMTENRGFFLNLRNFNSQPIKVA